MLFKKKNITACILIIFVFAITSSLFAQQQASTEIWRMAPSGALVFAGFDLRPDNSSMMAITKVEDSESRNLRIKQQADLRKSVESFATLFGISLDFTKDIESWADAQSAIVILQEGENQYQAVLMIASKNAAEASAAMQKILAPWERVGELVLQTDSDYPITSFKSKMGINVFASAYGNMMAFSPSKSSLKQALSGTGFPVGSAGDKVFNSLSGSLAYIFLDPSVLKRMHIMNFDIPVDGFGIGMSAIETGVKVNAIAYPSEQANTMLKQMLSNQQTGIITVNTGISSTSLIAASIPNLDSILATVGSLGPIEELVKDSKVSAAITAALPKPSGVISIATSSEENAALKLKSIQDSAKNMGVTFKPAQIKGIDASVYNNPNQNVYMAKVGKNILLATDPQSLFGSSSSINGETPVLADTAVYKEVMSGLGNCNLQSTFVNLAPVQGVGYLMEGIGMGQILPLYTMIAKGLENMQAMGFGLGYNGEAVNASMFIRAKPGIGAGSGAMVISSAAVGAATLYPMFAKAKEKARQSACMSNLKQLALGTIMYACDYDGKLPSKDNWQTEIYPYTKNNKIFSCPSDRSGYAINKNLAGLNLNKVINQSELVLFFEAEPGITSGSKADVVYPHNGGGNFVFADGHAGYMSYAPDQSMWVPKYATPKPAPKIPVKKAPAKKAPVKKPLNVKK